VLGLAAGQEIDQLTEAEGSPFLAAYRQVHPVTGEKLGCGMSVGERMNSGGRQRTAFAVAS
jgi:hypothetical protein